MKVSIIVPTYRRPVLLRAALASAAELDYDASAYEVCVINDGGSGVNRHAVRRWWPGKARLRYCRIPHAGLSAAVNRGLEIAEGELCTILPDDDTILPNKLRAMVPLFDAKPEVAVAYSLPLYIDAAGQAIRTPTVLRSYMAAHRVLSWRHVAAGHGLRVHGTSTVYRTSVCREVGGWDTNLKTGEEYEFHLRLLKLGYDFHAVDAVTTGYRVHPGSKSIEARRDRSAMRDYVSRKLSKL